MCAARLPLEPTIEDISSKHEFLSTVGISGVGGEKHCEANWTAQWHPRGAPNKDKGMLVSWSRLYPNAVYSSVVSLSLHIRLAQTLAQPIPLAPSPSIREANMSPLHPFQGPLRKLAVAIDVGTTYSGIAYAILDPGEVPRTQAVTRCSFSFIDGCAYGSHTQVIACQIPGPRDW